MGAPAPTKNARAFPDTLNLRAAWDFDPDTNNTSRGGAFTLLGAAAAVPGRNSGTFARSGARLYLADASFNHLGAISVVAEVFPYGVGIDATIAEYGGASSAVVGQRVRWGLRAGGDGNASIGYYCERDNGGVLAVETLTSPAVLELNKWQLVGFTRREAGTTVALFIDGVPVASSDAMHAPSGGNAGSQLNLLQNLRAGSNLFPGHLGRWAVYSRELTAEQMAWLARRNRRLI